MKENSGSTKKTNIIIINANNFYYAVAVAVNNLPFLTEQGWLSFPIIAFNVKFIELYNSAAR